jgi:hypothetical protein
MTSIPSARDILLEQFGQITYQFLDASCEVWPECDVLKSFKAQFDAANANPEQAQQFVIYSHGLFQEQFKPYVARLLSKDESILEEPIPFLELVQAKSKLSSVDASVKDTCFEYAKQIAQSASINDVYSKCPTRMMDQVATLASSFVKDVEQGTLDLANLNPLELSQKVMSTLNPADIEEFGKHLTAEGGMENIMAMMSGIMSQAGGPMGAAGGLPFDPSMIQSLMGAMPALTGGASGAPDMSSIMNMMSMLGKKK